MATEILELQVRTTGVTAATTELSHLESAGKLAAETMHILRSALVLVGAVRIGQAFVEFVDSFDEIHDRVAPFTTSATQLKDVLGSLGIIAQEGAQKLQKVSEVYIALAGSTSNLHLSQQQVVNGTRDFTDILVANGISLDNAKKSIQQFGIGLATGALSGRALTSIIRDAKPVADAIAQSFNTTSGALQGMVKNNPALLETGRVFKALGAAGDEARKKLVDVVDSVSDGFQRISTATQFFFGRLAEETGVGKSGLDFLSLLANNIDKVILAAAGFGTLLLLGVAIRNIVTIVGSAISVIGGFIDLITLIGPLITGVSSAFAVLTSVMLANPIIAGVALIAFAGFLTYLTLAHTSINSLIPSLNTVKIVLNSLIAAAIGAAQALGFAFQNFPKVLYDIFVFAVNGVIKVLERLVVVAAEVVNGIVKTFTLGFIDMQQQINGISFNGIQLKATGAAAGVATTFQAGFEKAFAGDPVNAIVDGVKAGYKKAADFFAGLKIPSVLPTITGGVNPGAASGSEFIPKDVKGAAEKIQRLKDEIESAVGKFDPYIKGIAEIDKFHTLLGKNAAVTTQVLAKLGITEEEVNKRMVRDLIGVGNAVTDMQGKIKLLDEAQKKGYITANEYAKAIRAIGSAAFSVVDSVSPLIAANNKLRESMQAVNDATTAGIDLGISADEINRRLLRDQVGVGNAATDLAEKEQLLNNAFKAGVISMRENEEQLRKLQEAYLQTQTDSISGFQLGILKVQDEYLNTAKDAEKTITDVFDNLQGTLEDFFKTGKLNFSKLIDGILADLTKLAIKGAITGPLSKLLGGGGYDGSTGAETDPFGGIFSAITGGFSKGSQQANDSLTTGLQTVFRGDGAGFNKTFGDTFNNQGGSFLDSLSSIFSSGGGSGGGGGGGFDIGGIFSSIFGGGGGGSTLPSLAEGGFFDTGGSIMVGGESGRDRNFLGLRVSKGEQVDILTPEQQIRRAQKGQSVSNPTVNFYITTPDADSFRRSQGQLGQMAAAGLSRAQQRNG